MALVLCWGPAAAQGIEVAAIRENTGPANDFSNLTAARFTPGRAALDNHSVEDLVARAFGVSSSMRRRLIVGWPTTAIRDSRFDIRATLTSDHTLSSDEQREVFLELLVNRFGLKVRKESRAIQAYLLRPLKTGFLGPRLSRVSFDCAVLSREEAPKDAEGKSLCRQGSEISGAVVKTHGSGTMGALTRAIQTIYNERLIVDATGLEGFFVWDLELGLPRKGRPVSFFTLLHEQLGLKLEPGTAPADVVVIERVSLPTPN